VVWFVLLGLWRGLVGVCGVMVFYICHALFCLFVAWRSGGGLVLGVVGGSAGWFSRWFAGVCHAVVCGLAVFCVVVGWFAGWFSAGWFSRLV